MKLKGVLGVVSTTESDRGALPFVILILDLVDSWYNIIMHQSEKNETTHSYRGDGNHSNCC